MKWVKTKKFQRSGELAHNADWRVGRRSQRYTCGHFIFKNLITEMLLKPSKTMFIHLIKYYYIIMSKYTLIHLVQFYWQSSQLHHNHLFYSEITTQQNIDHKWSSYDSKGRSLQMNGWIHRSLSLHWWQIDQWKWPPWPKSVRLQHCSLHWDRSPHSDWVTQCLQNLVPLVSPHSPQLIFCVWHSQPSDPPLHSGWTSLTQL